MNRRERVGMDHLGQLPRRGAYAAAGDGQAAIVGDVDPSGLDGLQIGQPTPVPTGAIHGLGAGAAQADQHVRLSREDRFEIDIRPTGQTQFGRGVDAPGDFDQLVGEPPFADGRRMLDALHKQHPRLGATGHRFGDRGQFGVNPPQHRRRQIGPPQGFAHRGDPGAKLGERAVPHANQLQRRTQFPQRVVIGVLGVIE